MSFAVWSEGEEVPGGKGRVEGGGVAGEARRLVKGIKACVGRSARRGEGRGERAYLLCVAREDAEPVPDVRRRLVRGKGVERTGGRCRDL